MNSNSKPFIISAILFIGLLLWIFQPWVSPDVGGPHVGGPDVERPVATDPEKTNEGETEATPKPLPTKVSSTPLKTNEVQSGQAKENQTPPVKAKENNPPAPPITSTTWKRPKNIGSLKFSALDECSGLAASQKNPGILWAHNDSGSSATVYAFDHSGSVRAKVLLQGVTAKDFEDIALGPHPKKKGTLKTENSYLYIADVGDNQKIRPQLSLYRFKEPELKGVKKGATVVISKIEKIDFKYPNIKFDCEALAVHPQTGMIYLFNKFPFRTTVFSLKNSTEKGKVQTAKKLFAINTPDLVTSADFSPDGTRFVLRTYYKIEEYITIDPKAPLSFKNVRRIASISHREQQGEAICYTGPHTLITVSEGAGSTLYKIERER